MTKGAEVLQQIKKGDVITSAKLISGADKLVVPQVAAWLQTYLYVEWRAGLILFKLYIIMICVAHVMWRFKDLLVTQIYSVDNDLFGR